MRRTVQSSGVVHASRSIIQSNSIYSLSLMPAANVKSGTACGIRIASALDNAARTAADIRVAYVKRWEREQYCRSWIGPYLYEGSPMNALARTKASTPQWTKMPRQSPGRFKSRRDWPRPWGRRPVSNPAEGLSRSAEFALSLRILLQCTRTEMPRIISHT